MNQTLNITSQFRVFSFITIHTLKSLTLDWLKWMLRDADSKALNLKENIFSYEINDSWKILLIQNNSAIRCPGNVSGQIYVIMLVLNCNLGIFNGERSWCLSSGQTSLYLLHIKILDTLWKLTRKTITPDRFCRAL